MHSWDKLNLSMKEAVWIGYFLGKWHIQTMHYDLGVVFDELLTRRSKHIFSFRKVIFFEKNWLVKSKSAHIMFYWVILRVKHFGICRVRILFVPVGWNWQIHSQHVPCSVPVLKMHTQDNWTFHKGGCVNWWFSESLEACPYHTL